MDTSSVHLANQLSYNGIEPFISAFSVIIGVIIGSVISYFIARLQFRATTLSANRQSWINTLRDSIAEVQQTASITITEVQLASNKQSANVVDSEAIVSAVRKMDFLFYKIQLLLNPKESDHDKLIDLIFNLKGSSLKVDDEMNKKHAELQREITQVAQNILKREWVRVKKGK